MSIDLSKIEKLYSDNLDQYGIDSRSVGWNSADSQTLRFKKLAQVIHDPTQPITVNELGCGYGEFLRYLDAEKFQVQKFSGYDISEKMLETAKTYINDDRAEWILAPAIDRKADYSFTSGIFNVKFEEQKENWEAYIKDTLRNMYEHSEKGMAFNLLTKYVDWEEPHLYYADPLVFVDFCKRELSRYVTLLHDYALWEWTIYVRRQP